MEGNWETVGHRKEVVLPLHHWTFETHYIFPQNFKLNFMAWDKHSQKFCFMGFIPFKVEMTKF